jgi:hypothetical protein
MLITAIEAKNANWACAASSLVILVTRIVATRYRDKRFDAATALVAASILVLATRIVVVYLYLIYGTSNDVLNLKNSDDESTYFNQHNISNIKAGSILSLIARLLITTFYWLQICLLLLFYSSILRDFHWIYTIKVCWILIVATYIAVVLSTFLECRPFHLYWQIEPNPGHCVRAYVQLFMQGMSNIVLDLFLLAISFPMLKMRNRTWAQTARVGALFILGFFTIIVTCLRIAYIHAEGSYQPVRSFWASVQMLTSTFVANAPTIYGCYQIVRRRKSEQRARRSSRPEIWVQLNESPSRGGNPPTPPPVAVIRTRDSGRDDEKAWARHVS